MDLFFTLNKIDITDHTDGNIPYTSSNDVSGLVKSSEEASNELFKWFNGNLLKSNPDKCNLLVSTNDNVEIRIGNFRIYNTKREKLLGIHFGKKIIYQKYAKKLAENFML